MTDELDVDSLQVRIVNGVRIVHPYRADDRELVTDGGREGSGRYRTRVGHCKQDETDVYAGRGPNGRDMFSVAKPGGRGWLGNPFPLADGITREESVESFRQAFEDKLERDAEFREAVGDLAGKTLGCWCQRLGEDEPACHAEIIAEHAVRIARQRDTGNDREEGQHDD